MKTSRVVTALSIAALGLFMCLSYWTSATEDARPLAQEPAATQATPSAPEQLQEQSREVDVRTSVSPTGRRLEVRYVGRPQAPTSITLWDSAGERSEVATLETRELDALLEDCRALWIEAEGFCPEFLVLEGFEQKVQIDLLALGSVHMRAEKSDGTGIPGIWGFLKFGRLESGMTVANRQARSRMLASLLDQDVPADHVLFVAEQFGSTPYDPVDRALACLGDRELGSTTDRSGESTWEDIPPLPELCIELRTSCRCQDPSMPSLEAGTRLSMAEFMLFRERERQSAPFQLEPGQSINHTFVCQQGGRVTGQLRPIGEFQQGYALIQDMRRDVTLVGTSESVSNEVPLQVQPDGSFAVDVQTGTKQLMASWSAGGCTYSVRRRFRVDENASVDLGTVAAADHGGSLTIQPKLIDYGGASVAWGALTDMEPPTVIVQYRVQPNYATANAGTSPFSGVQEKRCTLGQSVSLCGLPPGTLSLTTLLDWPPQLPGQVRPLLRRGAGKLQEVEILAGAQQHAAIPFIAEMSAQVVVAVHEDGDLAPAATSRPSATLIGVERATRITSLGTRREDGAWTFDFEAPQGEYVFYSSLPKSGSANQQGIVAMESVLVGAAPQVDSAWSPALSVAFANANVDPTRERVEIVLRIASHEVREPVMAPDELLAIPPGSGIDLVDRKRGFQLGAASGEVRLRL